MGHNNSQFLSFKKTLQPIETIKDAHFGDIDILRLTQLPFDYIVAITIQFRQNKQAVQQRIRSLEKVKELHSIEVIQQNNVCLQQSKIKLYCNYYNFTLGDARRKKRSMKKQFSQPELWYILYSIADLAIFLQERDISFGDYHSDQIFLTPQGFIKLYPYQIKSEGLLNIYQSVICGYTQITEHLPAPQQLLLLSKPARQLIDFNMQKAEVFSLGMIILECMLLQDPKFYYDYSNYSVDFKHIWYDLDILKKKYSPILIDLLSVILQKEAPSRPTFQNILQKIKQMNEYIEIAGAIRIMEQQRFLTKKQSIYMQKLNKQKILTSQLQSKLVPGHLQIVNQHRHNLINISSSSTQMSQLIKVSRYERNTP